MVYFLLKWLHVLSAIVVVGWHATYGFWVVRGSKHKEALPFILRNIQWLDNHVALPGFAIQLITGFSMVGRARVPLSTPWLLSGIVLWVLVLTVHLLVYRPALLRMSRLLESGQSDTPEYDTAAHREARVGSSLVFTMVVAVYLMVMKPPLWG